MALAKDVANFFIDATNRSADDQITNLKLNKLLYYAQGCYLARTGKPLFQDAIEAWTLGPVVPAIYHKYKVCGRAPIRAVDDDYSDEQFSEQELETLLDVMREFGQYTGSALVSMTHKAGTPWSETATGKVISNDCIRKYFEKNPIPTTEEIIQKIPRVDRFPADWYDPEEDGEWEAYL